MDVTRGGDAANAGADKVPDEVGLRVQKIFQDFLGEWNEEGSRSGVVKYLKPARELLKPERNTLTVSMKDVEQYKPELAARIMDEYYRVYPYICTALKNFVQVCLDIICSFFTLLNLESETTSNFT